MFVMLDSVTCKHVTNIRNAMANIWQDFFNAMAESWEKLKLQMIFLLFVVC